MNIHKQRSQPAPMAVSYFSKHLFFVSYSDMRSCIPLEHVFLLINFCAIRGLELDLSSKALPLHLQLTLEKFSYLIFFLTVHPKVLSTFPFQIWDSI